MNNKLMNPMGSLIDQFFNPTLSTLFNNDVAVSRPSANIVEHDDHFMVELSVPGFQKDQINLSIDGDQLNISAEVKSENEEVKGDYKRREFNYSSFSRSFTLNDLLDKENIEASYENGILNIKINKLEEAVAKKPLQIEVK